MASKLELVAEAAKRGILPPEKQALYDEAVKRGLLQPRSAESAQQKMAAIDPSEYDPESPEFQAKYGPAAVPASENFDAAVGKTFVDLARGAGQRLGVVSVDDVKASRQQDAPLMATKAGKAGNIAGAMAVAAPALLIPGANTVAGAGLVGAGMGLLQPTESAMETAGNVVLGFGAGAGGQKIGQKLGSWVVKKTAERAAKAATQQADDVVRQATLSAGREAGYVVPPSTVKPTVLNRVLESASGKAATQQAAAVKNQTVTNKLARKALGLPEDAPLTSETMQGIREQAGKVYEAVKRSGQIVADQRYQNQLAILGQKFTRLSQSFGKAKISGAQEITDLADALNEPAFDAESAVEFVKVLRAEAADNLGFSVTDPAKKTLGRAQSDAAKILEGMIDRHLSAQGNGQLMDEFRAARSLIAKSYTVEKAINEGTGNVVASKLAAALRAHKPLSKELRTVGKFAAAFPKAAAEQTHSPGVSAVDALVGGVGGMTVNPALAALPVGRLAARGAILSGPYQNMMLKPTVQGPSLTNFLLGTGAKLAPAAGVGVPAYIGE